ncbi:CHAT domain-containing protein [Boletus edulis BED1]|uniref:CHAT domain-containing protein n=1 Tax=Boletus edulis BED1 TaxID=1328754 RepID=A0AAD4BLU9_BOLED|nr:CHAT domain-containing protein [Boletus edulis BED1]
MEDLVEAVDLARQAVDFCQIGNPIRPLSLKTLAYCVSARYKQLKVTEDLNESVLLSREVLGLCPTGCPGRSAALDILATCLSDRYQQLKIMEVLDEAIVLGREALDLRPRGHPNRSNSLDNLASNLTIRYQQLKVIGDLDEAIVLGREGLDLIPIGHSDRSKPLNNLALHLFTRYSSLRVMEDLDEATVLGREAFDLCPQGHPDRSTMLSSLAQYLHSRFAQSKQVQDQDELFSLYAQLVQVTQIVFSNDLSAAREWIQVAEHFEHPTILLAYETSLRLLVQQVAILPSLPQSLVVLKNLTSSLAVDAFLAGLRNRSPTRAVELLEQGRGVFWSQLTRLRSPLDDVIASGPAGKTLAADLTHLASLIRNTLGSPAADQYDQLCHLNLKMQSVVTRIRELPGLSRFLLPLPFTDLQRAAIGGPVIIVNACKYSCDVLVIMPDGDPVHIPLQITLESVHDLSKELHTLTVRAARADVTREFAIFLRKLWDHIVFPIVDFLRTTTPPRSRIWWCPTGEFSALPLHAAAPYRKGQQSLSDLYISSYTPTLTALIRARRHSPSTSVASQGKHFVAIGQAKAAGETELPSVGAELDIIGQSVSDLATFMRIDGEDSCVSRVIEELGKNEWVHLACHGLPNRTQPLDSAFALHDGHFTVQQIIGCDLKNPEFAYLSACHTTVGYEESPDEVIHLASAMQFVGFRSVIGTMWAVDDGATTAIASTFYQYMVDEVGRLDHTRAAFALNKTMKSVKIPFDQRILYIHLGA